MLQREMRSRTQYSNLLLQGHSHQIPSLLSDQISDAFILDSKILLNCPLQERPPSYKATFSLQKGCSYKRETTAYVSTSNDHVLLDVF